MLFTRTLENIQRTHTGKPFEMVFWNGERWRFGAPAGGAPEFVIRFKTRTSFARSVLQTTLGLGEAYVAGDLGIEGNLEDALTTLFEIGLKQPPRSTWRDPHDRASARWPGSVR